MSPAARAQAEARSGAAPASSPAKLPNRPRPVRRIEPTPGRFDAISTALRSGNLMGRIGMVSVAAIFVALFGVVVFQTLLVQGQARLDTVNKRTNAEQLRSKDLHRLLADLESPDHIVTTARDRLGMVSPGEVGYLQTSADDDAKAAWIAPPAPPVTAPATTPKATTPKMTAPKTTTSTTPKTSTKTTTTKTTTTKTTTAKSPTTTPPKGTRP